MEKLFWPAIHLFGLVAFIIYKTKGSFIDFIKNRHDEISDGLNRAKNQAASVEARKNEIEAKLSGLQKEKEVIFSEWKEKEVEQLKIIKDSSERALIQMKGESERNKKNLEEQFKAQIMKEVAAEVIVRVESKIKSELNDQLHRSINERITKEVSV